jgi:hypothetical protein
LLTVTERALFAPPVMLVGGEFIAARAEFGAANSDEAEKPTPHARSTTGVCEPSMAKL